MSKKQTELSKLDTNHVWHPYTSMSEPLPAYEVVKAKGVYLELNTGEQLIDGMSSWWSVLHGYNHPVLNKALVDQANDFSHVMFGGITHKPAVELCKTLVDITPRGLNKVFLSDSGSVAVEVSMKMAIQYWQSKGLPDKSKFMTVRNGYHGDTFAAMSVCDPVTGMHQLFDRVLMQNIFAPAPVSKFGETFNPDELTELNELFAKHQNEIAAFIIEPIVQGTGGMRFYHPDYLSAVKSLCEKYNVLLIADEIATGLGRTGKLFACDWAGVSPDIMCLGKTLTAGYITLAATLCTDEIAATISDGEAKCFMHGPTYMGNALACSVANASIKLLRENDWETSVKRIESWLEQHFLPLSDNPLVQDARVLGTIAALEMNKPVNVANIQKQFVSDGVWIRPFGKLIYIMPPLVINEDEVKSLVNAIANAITNPKNFID